MILASLAAFAVVPSGALGAPPAKGALIAIDLRSGKERWRATTPGAFALYDVSESTVVGRGFDCETSDFRTIAFETSGGKRRWQRPAAPDNAPHGSDTLATGSTRTAIALSLASKRLAGIDASTGRERWSVRFTSNTFVETNATVVVAGGSEGTYPNDHGVLRARDRASGKELWTMTDAATNRLAVAYADDTSIVAAFNSADGRSVEARVLDPRTGQLRWTTTLGETVPAGSVVVARQSNPASIHAFDAKTGDELWSRPGSAAIVPIGKRLTLRDGGGTITVVNARTGDVRWTLPETRWLVGDAHTMAIVDQRSRLVTVVDPDTGAARGKPISLPNRYEVVHSVVVAGNTLYASLGCQSYD